MPQYDDEWSYGPWSWQREQSIDWGMPILQAGDFLAYTQNGQPRFAARQQMIADGGPITTMAASAVNAADQAVQETVSSTPATGIMARVAERPVAAGIVLGVALYLVSRWARQERA